MRTVLGPILLVVAAMASIQLGAALAKGVLFPAVGAQGTTALRVALAALILLVVRRPWREPPTGRDALWIGLYGAALGAMNLLFYESLRTIPLGIAVAVEFTGPLAVAVLSSRRAIDFLWVALAGAGVILLSPWSAAGQHLDPRGLAFSLGAGVCWALYIVFGKRAGEGGGGRAASLGMAVAALIAFPVGYAQSGPVLFSLAVLPAALGVAVLSSALPYSLEMVALSRLPQRTFGVLMSLEPALGALSGLLLLNQRLSLGESAAIACVMAASFGSAATTRASEIRG